MALRKPPMAIPVLGEAEVRELLDPAELLDALADGFRALSAGAVSAPPRGEIALPGGAFLLSMPAALPSGPLLVKVVTVFDGNPRRGLPSHLATIALYDRDTGACVAFLDGTYVTAIRTAAAAALALRLLGREDARTLTLVGGGVQAHHHLALLPLVRDLHEIRVASLRREDAEALAAADPRARAVDLGELEEAVRGADVVALATHAAEPVIEASWVPAGAHVSSIGYAPPRGELPPDLLDRATLFVETRAAFEPTPVGCAELAGRDPASGAELGEVLSGTRPGRTDAGQITVYKAMGHAVEDLVAATLVHRRALERGAGRVAEL